MRNAKKPPKFKLISNDFNKLENKEVEKHYYISVSRRAYQCFTRFLLNGANLWIFPDELESMKRNFGLFLFLIELEKPISITIADVKYVQIIKYLYDFLSGYRTAKGLSFTIKLSSKSENIIKKFDRKFYGRVKGNTVFSGNEYDNLLVTTMSSTIEEVRKKLMNFSVNNLSLEIKIENNKIGVFKRDPENVEVNIMNIVVPNQHSLSSRIFYYVPEEIDLNGIKLFVDIFQKINEFKLDDVIWCNNQQLYNILLIAKEQNLLPSLMENRGDLFEIISKDVEYGSKFNELLGGVITVEQHCSINRLKQLCLDAASQEGVTALVILNRENSTIQIYGAYSKFEKKLTEVTLDLSNCLINFDISNDINLEEFTFILKIIEQLPRTMGGLFAPKIKIYNKTQMLIKRNHILRQRFEKWFS